MESSVFTQSSGLLGWIPLVPLMGAVVNIFLGVRMGRKGAGLLASACVAVSFILSLWISLSLPTGSVLKDTLFIWIESHPTRLAISEANSLAMEQSFLSGRPASCVQAA